MIKLCLVELAPLPVAFLLLVAGPQDGWAKKNKELTDPCQGWWDCNQFCSDHNKSKAPKHKCFNTCDAYWTKWIERAGKTKATCPYP